MRRSFAAALLAAMLFCHAAFGETCTDTLTYAVFPYLPDAEYYQELIEERWAEIEPDIQLVRASWDCYLGTEPEGIDVVMFDAAMMDSLIRSGWIQPVPQESVEDIGDFFPFVLEGLTAEGELYGIPVFLCGNFLIWDEDCEALAEAMHITDLAEMSGILLINSGVPDLRHQYSLEAAADALGDPNPDADDGQEEILLLLDRLAVREHLEDDDTQIALAYDSGIGQGYIGYSESLRLLKNRGAQTQIRSISFSDRENVLRLYADAAAVTTRVQGERYEKCLELINLMADAEVLTALSVREGSPDCLLLARKSPYEALSAEYGIYDRLEELAGDEGNHVILVP